MHGKKKFNRLPVIKFEQNLLEKFNQVHLSNDPMKFCLQLNLTGYMKKKN